MIILFSIPYPCHFRILYYLHRLMLIHLLTGYLPHFPVLFHILPEKEYESVRTQLSHAAAVVRLNGIVGFIGAYNNNLIKRFHRVIVSAACAPAKK